jgi:hypothetical protein
MATGLSALTTGGTLLAVFLTFIASAAAQTTSPALTTLYSFAQDPNDGSNPNAIVIGSGGVLYGTTEFGGTARLGAVFALTPPASPGGPWSETVLYSFMGVSDGVQPNSLTIGPGGILYGTSGGGQSKFWRGVRVIAADASSRAVEQDRPSHFRWRTHRWSWSQRTGDRP